MVVRSTTIKIKKGDKNMTMIQTQKNDNENPKMMTVSERFPVLDDEAVAYAMSNENMAYIKNYCRKCPGCSTNIQKLQSIEQELYEQRRNLYKQLDSVVVKVTEDEDIKVTSQRIIRALISN